MKFFAFLLSVLALIACSESENVAEVFDGDLSNSSSVVAEESSSSVFVLPSSSENASSSSDFFSSSSLEISSDSKESSSSSSSEKALSSSSKFYIPLLIEIYLKDYISDSAYHPKCDSGISAFSDLRPYYKLFINERAKKLSANGTPSNDDKKRAVMELFLTLEIDSLFKKIHFTRAAFEDALNLFLNMDSTGKNDFVKTFSETGAINRTELCNLWATKADGIVDETSAYGKDLLLTMHPRFRGCIADDVVPEVPYVIFNNLYRICVGLPICGDDLFGAVRRASLVNVIRDTNYVCQKDKWIIPENYEQDIKDVPCNKIGKMFKSSTVEERYYVCKKNGWNITTKIDYETRDSICPGTTKIMQSPTDTNVFYFCQYSQWRIASDIDRDTIGQPCDRVGKIIQGRVPHLSVNELYQDEAYAYYYCTDMGWRYASFNESNIGDEACDSEGKVIQGKLDSTFYYVCYKNKWVNFNEAPCDTDNKRLVGLNTWGNKCLYICYNGKWYNAQSWSCQYPKDYYFNPDVEYGTLKDERDGETYRTVEFNGYTWMAENLRYIMPDSSQSILFTDSCEIGGRFYSKEAARTACPNGWKLPDSAAVYSLFAPNFNQLSADEQITYFKQFMSEIGSFCANASCNTYGTTFFSLGTTLTSNRYSGPNYTFFWADNKRENDPWHFGFFANSMFYSKPDEDVYMPIRCVKE